MTGYPALSLFNYLMMKSIINTSGKEGCRIWRSPTFLCKMCVYTDTRGRSNDTVIFCIRRIVRSFVECPALTLKDDFFNRWVYSDTVDNISMYECILVMWIWPLKLCDFYCAVMLCVHSESETNTAWLYIICMYKLTSSQMKTSGVLLLLLVMSWESLWGLNLCLFISRAWQPVTASAEQLLTGFSMPEGLHQNRFNWSDK